MRERRAIAAARKRKAIRRQRRILLLACLCLAIIAVSLCFSFITNADSAKISHTYKYYTDITVQPGESLWDIAMDYMTEEYDSPKAYIREVQNINDIINPDSVYVGQKLIIPYFSEEYK